MTNNPKYKLCLDDTKQYGDITLYRIEALRDFGPFPKGYKGGYIESESNLSHNGECWVGIEAKVYGSAKVLGNSLIEYGPVIAGNITILGDSRIYGKLTLCSFTEVNMTDIVIAGDLSQASCEVVEVSFNPDNVVKINYTKS